MIAHNLLMMLWRQQAEVFCLEGEPKHLARTDSSCDHHTGTTTGIREMIINLVRLQVEVCKASNRAVKQG